MRAWQGVVGGLLVAALTVGGTIASAQKAPGPVKETDPLQNLKLSADQRTKLDKVTNDRKTALTATQQKIKGIREKLRGLLFDKKASDSDIDKVADQLAKADREAILSEIKFHKAMRQLLTQEQLTTLVKGDK